MFLQAGEMFARAKAKMIEPDAKDFPDAIGARTNPAWLVAAIVLVAWSCLNFPQDTLNQLPDPSWEAVLLHARATGMQFGRDLIFTYGPLGFLSISCFSPEVAMVRIFFEVTLSLIIATGFCLVIWRMPRPWRVLTLGFFILVATPLHWGGAALFIDLGLFVWGLLCFLGSGRRLYLFVVGLVALVVVGALIKFTFLVTGIFTIGLLTVDLLLRGRRVMAAGILLGSVAGFVGGWILLGQKLSGLSAFLSSSYAVAEGYNLAMGQRWVNIGLLLLIATATLAAIVMRVFGESNGAARSQWLRRGLLVVWVLGLVFLNWKYISVRGDYYHLKLLFGFMPIVALCVEAIPAAGQRALNWSRISILACLFVAAIMIHGQISKTFFPINCVKQTYRDMAGSAAVLWHPARYIEEKTDALRAEQQREQLPKIRAAVGQATVDVFGQNQAVAFANGLNYRPRPIFQSYSAYNRGLMELNEQYYLSSNAPEYVIAQIQPIDDRFPPLEDALDLRDLLINYEQVLTESNVCLLKKIGTLPARLTLLKEGSVRAGDRLDLRDQPDENLWLELSSKISLPGRLCQFLYKPQDMKLVLQRASAVAPLEKFNAPGAMMAAGFLVRPQILTSQDLGKLWNGEPAPAAVGLSVEIVPSPWSTWSPEIPYRLYRIENKIGGQR